MAKKPAKVQICHVNSGNQDNFYVWGLTFATGKVIEVSEKALPAHLAHGDSEVFWANPPDYYEWLEEVYGIWLPNADCHFIVE